MRASLLRRAPGKHRLKSVNFILAWGSGDGGGLGTGFETQRNFPFPEPVYEMSKIKTLAVGQEHLLIVTQAGELFAVGNNFGGQIGMGEEQIPLKNPLYPMRITGGIPHYKAESWNHSFITGAYAHRLDGPISPVLYDTGAKAQVLKITAVTAAGGASYALTQTNKVLSWSNGKVQGYHGDFNREAVGSEKVNAFEKVHQDEERGIFYPVWAPEYVQTAGPKMGGTQAVSGNITGIMLGQKGGAVSIDWKKEKSTRPKTFIATADSVVSFINFPTTSEEILFYFKQDSVGGRKVTFPGVEWGVGGEPAWDLGPERINPVPLYWDAVAKVCKGGHPKTLEKVQAVSAGHKSALYLLENGEIYISGEATGGNVAVYAQPLESMIGEQPAIAVSAGGEAGIALMEDHTVRTFGHNTYGQLGNGKPDEGGILKVNPGLTKVVAIAAEESHMLVLKDDGTLWSWGRNKYGECGNITNEGRLKTTITAKLTEGKKVITNMSVGTFVVGQKIEGPGIPPNTKLKNKLSATEWKMTNAVEAGKSGISVSCSVWEINVRSPVKVEGMPNPEVNAPVAISVGGESIQGEGVKGGPCNLVLMEDRTVRTWGQNNEGQIGDMTQQDKYLPVQPPVSNIEQIEAGCLSMFVVQKTGTAPSTVLKFIPEPGKVKVVWRDVGSPGEIRPELSYSIKYRNTELGPQSPEEISHENLPGSNLREPFKGLGPFPTEPGKVKTVDIPLSPPKFGGSSKNMEFIVTGAGSVDEPLPTVTYGQGEPDAPTKLIKVNWKGTFPEPGWIVKWRRVEKYTSKGGKLNVLEEWHESEVLPGGLEAKEYMIELEPFETGGGTPPILTSEPLTVKVEGVYQGAFQLRNGEMEAL